jgi:hypothetical protein
MSALRRAKVQALVDAMRERGGVWLTGTGYRGLREYRGLTKADVDAAVDYLVARGLAWVALWHGAPAVRLTAKGARK